MTSKFSLGHLVATPNALHQIPHADIMIALQRHAIGDWGEMDEHDWNENETSFQEGSRLLSVYRSTAGEKFWIITEADRSATTILMPEDY